ncbi:hypothetical protein ABZT43_47990, partial [Streptomyces sp. NPDC005349]
MADEKDSGSGSIRGPSWDHPVVATVALELGGLAVSGLVALVGWPFGWLGEHEDRLDSLERTRW